MDPAQLTATQLADHVLRFCTQNRDRLDSQAWDVAFEVCRRVRQHETLLRDLLPDLRARLTAAEESACGHPAGVTSSPP